MSELWNKKTKSRTSLVVQRLRLQVPMQGGKVLSLVGELRSHMCAKLLQSCLTLRPHRLQPSRLLSPWSSTGQNTRMGCHALLQGIFLMQRSNSHLLYLLHHRQILYHWATTCHEAEKKKKRERERKSRGRKCFLGNCDRLSLLTLPAFEKVYNLINFHEQNIWKQHPDQNTRVFLALTSLHVLPPSSGPRTSHRRDLSSFVHKWIHTICTLCE